MDIAKEMTKVRIAFDKLDGITTDEMRKVNIKPGYEHANVHMIFYIKMDRKLFIYFAIALVQKSVPDCLSISYASFTFLGTCITNLCDVQQYLDFTLEIILSLCRNFSLTHQLKAGSSLISFVTEYSASPTGLDCLRSFSGNQSTEPSFHSTKISHPRVFLFR